MENTCACVLGLEHSCSWPRVGSSSEGLSLALDFLVSLALASSLVSSTPPLVASVIMFLQSYFLCHVFKALIFIKIGRKLSYFKKCKTFERWRRPQTLHRLRRPKPSPIVDFLPKRLEPTAQYLPSKQVFKKR